MSEFREILARAVFPEIFREHSELQVDIACLEHEINELRPDLPEPEVICEIASKEASTLLSSIAARAYVLDRNFLVPTIESWEEFLAADKTDELDYVKEGHDCDNFGIKLALRAKDWLPGCSTGFVFDLDHAWTFIILMDENSELVVRNIEPQTDGTPAGIDDIRLAMMW